jgi:plasmid stabilization system protein ParE
MEIRWSLPAAEDLERICVWIPFGRTSPRMSGRRELAFPPLPYIAVDRVKENVIEISRIFHGAEDGP